MHAWSHLPNAPLIDWVLQSLKTNPKKWDAAYNASRDVAYNASRDVAYNASRDAAWKAAWDATRAAAWDAARATTLNAAWDAALNKDRIATLKAACRLTWDVARSTNWIIARDVILALIAYDDCQQYLDMSYDQLLAWATLSERPQAILLLPLKWIQENEHTLVTSR